MKLLIFWFFIDFWEENFIKPENPEVLDKILSKSIAENRTEINR